jgi:hypothetical protein
LTEITVDLLWGTAFDSTAPVTGASIDCDGMIFPFFAIIKKRPVPPWRLAALKVDDYIL